MVMGSALPSQREAFLAALNSSAPAPLDYYNYQQQRQPLAYPPTFTLPGQTNTVMQGNLVSLIYC